MLGSSSVPLHLILSSMMILILCDQIQVSNSFTTTTTTTLKGKNNNIASLLFMAPQYDPTTRRWEPTDPEEEGESAGYPLIGSLIRQGPVPFFQRLKDPDSYDQAVLKMMASENMSRNEAQGNMDAYLQNPNDWALQKMEEKNGAPKFDYANANMDSSDLILTGTWSGILLGIICRIVYVTSFGCDDFCRQYHF